MLCVMHAVQNLEQIIQKEAWLANLHVKSSFLALSLGFFRSVLCHLLKISFVLITNSAGSPVHLVGVRLLCASFVGLYPM